MSGGEQQMLAIGRAMMGRPKFLLLDEPSSMGISLILTERIYETIAEINQQDDHPARRAERELRARRVVSRLRAWRRARSPMSNAFDALRTDPEVQKAYLGT